MVIEGLKEKSQDILYIIYTCAFVCFVKYTYLLNVASHKFLTNLNLMMFEKVIKR